MQSLRAAPIPPADEAAVPSIAGPLLEFIRSIGHLDWRVKASASLSLSSETRPLCLGLALGVRCKIEKRMSGVCHLLGWRR